MTEILRRAARRLDDFTLTSFCSVFRSLSRYYVSMADRPQRG